MKLFACPHCGATAYFRTRDCASCGAWLVFEPERHAFDAAAAPCRNRAAIGCNWAAAETGFCRACAMTEVIPDAFQAGNVALWAEAEAAKRWVLETLARWGWFSAADPGPAPVFHLLSERTREGDAPVMTGHLSGLVTINVVEGDPAELIRRREAMGEPYRTLEGHFRHELAHFLFERLCALDGFPDAFRALFGDERADYGAALAAYHQNGAPGGWSAAHISAYATAHPHEDWAETAAHAMALTDMLDSALAAGLAWPGAPGAGFDAYAEADAAAAFEHAVALSVAMNHVNRAMGLDDLYAFVLTPAVREKLVFAHGWLRGGPGLRAA
jgi:hypothetical protein